ncbi:hypothetical protein ASG01_03620 [Chryseobacterium sp. Leaf180]|uniref:hypothetical protein n=1 Tax=Chryseobacterium sp. Leaf180 TaxID=1736289 RepID=UPI0006F34930|nr:hypothetical protein [Chryseobacterium sp. Leaf180]KQR94965.1 hypothetical protein ASG01_03620 [Chryseobacterium sp. Leaf180]
MKISKLFYLRLIVITVLMLDLISCESKKSSNPLSDTQWVGMAKIPEETEVVLKFSSDKLDVFVGSKVIENMSYTVSNGEITLVKKSGGTPCNNGSTGKYKYETVGDNLIMTLISDECTARIKSVQGVIYKKYDGK